VDLNRRETEDIGEVPIRDIHYAHDLHQLGEVLDGEQGSHVLPAHTQFAYEFIIHCYVTTGTETLEWLQGLQNLLQ
jgi:hypothetical protein